MIVLNNIIKNNSKTEENSSNKAFNIRGKYIFSSFRYKTLLNISYSAVVVLLNIFNFYKFYTAKLYFLSLQKKILINNLLVN